MSRHTAAFRAVTLSFQFILLTNSVLAQPPNATFNEPDTLHRAVLIEDVRLVRQLLESGSNANAANDYQVTPLSIACTVGNLEIARLLLDAKADCNLAINGETPLMTASRTGRVELVESLLTRGAVVDSSVGKQQQAIHWAAAEGHADVVLALIKAGADPSAKLDSGFNPLLFAARQGHRDVVRVLLAAGTDLKSIITSRGNSRSPRPGTTALMLAVENGHFELAVDLVEAGSDPNELASGFAPLHAITWVRKPNRGDDPDGDPPPYGSGKLTSLDFVKKLVSHGADVNLRATDDSRSAGRLTKTGATPFLMAADTADLPLMRLLKGLGADAKLANKDQTTPLLAAAGVGTYAPGEEAGTEAEVVEAINYLLELGADINEIDKNGETVMHGAAYKGIANIVPLLVHKGAKVEIWNRENKYGWTPLSIAEGYRHGNFRPLSEMVAVIEQAMREQGVTPVPHKQRGGKGNRDPYQKSETKQ